MDQPAQSFDRGEYQPRSPRRSGKPAPRLSGGGISGSGNTEDIPGARPKQKAFDHKKGVDTTAKSSHGIIYDGDQATRKEMMPDMQAKVQVAGAPRETPDALVQREKRLSATEYKQDVNMQAKKTVGIGAAQTHNKGSIPQTGLSYDREVGLQKKKGTAIPAASDRYVEKEMQSKSRPNAPYATDQAQLFDHKAGTANKWDRESGKRVFGAPETEHLFQAKKEVGGAPPNSMKASNPTAGNTTLFQAKKEVKNAHSQDSVNGAIRHSKNNTPDNSIFQHKKEVGAAPQVSMKGSNPSTGNTTLFQAKKEVAGTRQAQVDTAGGVITGSGKGQKEQNLMQNKQVAPSTRQAQVDTAGGVITGSGQGQKEQHLMQNKRSVGSRPKDTAGSVIFG